MKLTQKQKDFLKTIKNKKTRKYQKQQFKLQNAFASALGMGKGETWYEENLKETESKFNKLAKKYMPKEDMPPKEFCVEITEENKEVLQTVYDKFHDGLTVDLNNKEFLHSNSIFSYCFPSNVSTYNSKFILIVPTEEFLKLIGREDLIETPESKRNYKISEIVDKVVELSKEKLEFDLPKKEYNKDLDYLLLPESNHLCWIYNRLLTVHCENPNYDYMLKLRDIILKENEKQYTLEDMRKCFDESKVFDTIFCGYKYRTFEDYINSLK